MASIKPFVPVRDHEDARAGILIGLFPFGIKTTRHYSGFSCKTTRLFSVWEALAPGIRGGIGEQMAAQQLHLLSGGFTQDGQLFHWRREGGRTGEIDYLLELHAAILPVEVKSGAAGSMKSLHQFMHDKGLPLALRLDRNPPRFRSAFSTSCLRSLHSLVHSVPPCPP